jgi:hypothetical protein
MCKHVSSDKPLKNLKEKEEKMKENGRKTVFNGFIWENLYIEPKSAKTFFGLNNKRKMK